MFSVRLAAFNIGLISVSFSAEGRNKNKQRRTVFARFLQGLRQSGDELNANEGMQLKVSERTRLGLQRRAYLRAV